MTDSPLLFERNGAVATLTMNRPDVGNSIDVALADALLEAALTCDADASIRAVVLTGAGKMFCAGGDVKGFAEAGDAAPALLKRLTSSLHMAIARFTHMDKPLITAINGAAAGAGFSLAILGDIAIAAKSAQFALAYGAIGLSPDGGATWLLPRLIGLRKAQQLALAGERVGAEEAARIGLVTQVAEDGAALADAQALAEKLSRSAVGAIGQTRELLLGSFDASLESHLEREAQAISRAAGGAEGREGVAAFVGKRKPDFRGAVGG